jgi:hypothetical protein
MDQGVTDAELLLYREGILLCKEERGIVLLDEETVSQQILSSDCDKLY